MQRAQKVTQDSQSPMTPVHTGQGQAQRSDEHKVVTNAQRVHAHVRVLSGAQRAEARAELSVELAQARILPAYELGR